MNMVGHAANPRLLNSPAHCKIIYEFIQFFFVIRYNYLKSTVSSEYQMICKCGVAHVAKIGNNFDTNKIRTYFFLNHSK